MHEHNNERPPGDARIADIARYRVGSGVSSAAARRCLVDRPGC